MKLLLLSVALACQVFAFSSRSACQVKSVGGADPDRPHMAHGQQSPTDPAQPERLHFSIPFPDGDTGRVELAASSAQRDLSTTETQSVLQLRGKVEVRMVTCPPKGHGCDFRSMVLHADAVDYNVKTGALDAHGNVHIDPYRSNFEILPKQSSLKVVH